MPGRCIFGGIRPVGMIHDSVGIAYDKGEDIARTEELARSDDQKIVEYQVLNPHNPSIVALFVVFLSGA